MTHVILRIITQVMANTESSSLSTFLFPTLEGSIFKDSQVKFNGGYQFHEKVACVECIVTTYAHGPLEFSL